MKALLIATLWVARWSVAFAQEKENRGAESMRQRRQVLMPHGELNPAKAHAYLDRRRMPPFPPEARADVLTTLPPRVRRQRITSREKLLYLEQVLQPVLAYHGLEGQIEIVLFRDLAPTASLFGRAAILISTKLLAITNETELRGLAAHELAHEYQWWEVIEARRNRDCVRLREIELFCDAVAALTLQEIGEKPLDYGVGLRHSVTLGEYIGSTSREGGESHPRLQDRLDFNRELAQRLISYSVMSTPNAAARSEPK